MRRNALLLGLWLGAGWLAAGCGKGRESRPAPVQGTQGAVAGPAVTFRDAAAESGLTFEWGNQGKHPLNILEIMGAGAGFLDYDGDGRLDVLCVGNGKCGLFHNEGGRFVDVTAGSGFDRATARWHGMAVADYNRDGRPDVFLTGYRRKQLFRNEGGGRFAPVSVPALDQPRWGSAAAFIEANGDGYPDLIVGNYVVFGPGSPEFMDRNGVKITLGPDAYQAEKLQLLINDRRGGFRDASRQSGVQVSRGRCLGIGVYDFDLDGDDDFYVANDEMPGNLFVNDGKGRFTDAGVESGTALSGSGKRQGGMGVAWGDYDNDLKPDLMVTTFTEEPKSLYHNDGGGFFTERSYQAGISQSTLRWVGFGVAFFDADHDGRLDLAMANGHVEDLIEQVDPLNSYRQPLKLFRNLGGGRFEDRTEAAGPGFRNRIVGRALAAGDYDNDGDLDLLVADLEGPVLLLRNEGGSAAGHWLTLALRGVRSESSGIGARVIVQAGGASQMRQCRTDSSYLTAQDPRVHFGLGDAAVADEVLIRWPSGATQSLKGVKADRILEVREP